MDNRKFNLLRFALQVGGFITIIIGIAHIFMPEFGYPENIPNSMDSNIREHFYYLGTYAICGFLLTLGGLSTYFSKLENIRNSLVVCFLLAILWIFRATLEIIYPVEIPIFMLETPHSVLFFVIMVLAISYSIGIIQGYRVFLKLKHK